MKKKIVWRAQEKRLVASAATFRGSINGETDETNGNSSAKRIRQPKPAALDIPQLNTFLSPPSPPSFFLSFFRSFFHRLLLLLLHPLIWISFFLLLLNYSYQQLIQLQRAYRWEPEFVGQFYVFPTISSDIHERFEEHQDSAEMASCQPMNLADTHLTGIVRISNHLAAIWPIRASLSLSFTTEIETQHQTPANR